MLHQFSLLCFSINQIENCHCVSLFAPCQDHNWEGTGFFCRKEIYVQSGFVFFGNASNLVIDFFFKSTDYIIELFRNSYISAKENYICWLLLTFRCSLSIMLCSYLS